MVAVHLSGNRNDSAKLFDESSDHENLDVTTNTNMKIILSSRRHHYVARVSIFLITVALIMGMVSCAPIIRYDLTISSTNGGSVSTPGEGTFTYNEGKVVRLVARPALGYTFVKWTGDVATIANVRSFSTTITINGNYSITANFGCGC